MLPWFWPVIIVLIIIIIIVLVIFVIYPKPLPDLLIEKTDSPDPVMAGGILTYTIKVTNNGLADATTVRIVDAIPSEVEFRQSQPAGCTQPNPPGPVVCDVGTIRPNETKQVDIQVTVRQSTPNTIIANTATTIDGADANTSDNIVTELTKIIGVQPPICPEHCIVKPSIEEADYGDAPDSEPTTYPLQFAQTGNFPSYLSNDGARAIGPSTVWLSSPIYNFEISHEFDYVDPGDPDGRPNLETDFDDGFDYDWLGTPGPGTFSGILNVHFWMDGSAPEAAYLNLFLDKNMNGDWTEPSEWMLVNEFVTFSGPTPIDKEFSIPNFFINVDNGEGCYWARATISTTPLSANGGTSEFPDGEVEDWLLRYPDQRCDGSAFGEAGGWPPIGSTP